MAKYGSWFGPLVDGWNAWREKREQRKKEKIAARQARRAAVVQKPQDKPRTKPAPEPQPEEAPELDEIPICALEDTPPWEAPAPVSAPAPVQQPTSNVQQPVSQHPVFHLPQTDLLNEPTARSEFAEQELKNIAVR